MWEIQTCSNEKPDNLVQMTYENFSSLSIFVEGCQKQKKIRQLNKLIKDYGVDLLAGCETRADWQFVTNEEDRFCNLFGNGQPALGLLALNNNDAKIKWDQWEGMYLVATG